MKKQAERLRLIRVSKGMSQENVSKALDITVGAYSKIERGVTKLSLNRLADLAKIFDIELNDFKIRNSIYCGDRLGLKF